MSDQPPAAGWWRASDGNWYPPQDVPAPPAAEPTQQVPAQPQYPSTQPVPAQPQYGAPPQYRSQPQYPPTQQVPAQPQYGGGFQPPGAGAPGVPVGQPAQKKGKGPVIGIVVVLAVLVVGGIIAALLVARSGDSEQTTVRTDNRPDTSGDTRDEQIEMKVRPQEAQSDLSISGELPTDVSQVQIQNDDGSELNSLMKSAIVDLSGWWSQQMPEIFGTDFQPISGGFWAWTSSGPVPPCAESADDIAGNAFYCSQEDNIAWDAEGLLPNMLEQYGPLAAGVTMAHEWGHAIQARVGMTAATVTLEQQADCYAGSWLSHLADDPQADFPLTDATIDGALAGLLSVADQPGTSASDPSAHGSAFDRANAFQDGIESGPSQCAGYTDENLVLVALPFTRQDDFDRGGNLPYADVVPTTLADIEDYWRSTLPSAFGTEWTALAPIQGFDSSSSAPPACGTDDTSGYALFYCASGNFIAFDDGVLFPQIAGGNGDFAVSTLLATQYGLAVQSQLAFSADSTKEQNLTADCLAGSWAGDVFDQKRADTGSLVLSPGDLDEAIQILLTFGESSDSVRGSGFDRVKAYRDGVLGGPSACLSPN